MNAFRELAAAKLVRFLKDFYLSCTRQGEGAEK
jgi:hypothetical protein